MAVLARIAALAALVLAGCYDPALRDCKVTCHGAGECASGQVCGNDGFCASPEVAGTCKTRPDASDEADAPQMQPDANTTPDSAFDAPVVIDGAPDGNPDAGVVQLHITITNKGKVVDSTNTITCNSPPGDCLFNVEQNKTITLTAVGSAQHPFDKWTDATCGASAGTNPTCTVVTSMAVTLVTAAFK
jgi:hypothetical protein